MHPDRFYLGVDAHLLGRLDVPLMVSHRRLARRRRLPPPALAPWVVDSGAFTELNLHGRHVTPPHEYAAAVRRYRDEVGRLAWAAPQDWMVEPFVLARTGYRVEDHQRMTVENLVHLRELAPDLPWLPVLQGWTLADYRRCARMYGYAGVDLTAEPLVGIGSVCRRQSSGAIEGIVVALAADGLALHGFGVKTEGLERYAGALASADSFAWSYQARRVAPLDGCTHRNCNACPRYALAWRERVLARIARPQQAALPVG